MIAPVSELLLVIKFVPFTVLYSESVGMDTKVRRYSTPAVKDIFLYEFVGVIMYVF